MRAEIRRLITDRDSDVHVALYHASHLYTTFTEMSRANGLAIRHMLQEVISSEGETSRVEMLMRADLDNSEQSMREFEASYVAMVDGIRKLGATLQATERRGFRSSWKNSVSSLRSVVTSSTRTSSKQDNIDAAIEQLENDRHSVASYFFKEADREVALQDPTAYRARLVRGVLERAQDKLKRVPFTKPDRKPYLRATSLRGQRR